jgi:hypothetical protein
MGKLNKFKINSERMLKNEELLTLRGGYGYVSCRKNGSSCGGGRVGNCSMASQACNIVCPGWTEAICAG